jgi:hypothetical protein
MEDTSILYIQYLRGCERFGWEALSEEDFLLQYQRLQRCEDVLWAYERQRGSKQFRRQLGSLREWWRIQMMIRNVSRARRRLQRLEQAVIAGSSPGTGWKEDEGGAGVAVRPLPEPPVLSGSAARLLPCFDPEPAFRDP